MDGAEVVVGVETAEEGFVDSIGLVGIVVAVVVWRRRRRLVEIDDAEYRRNLAAEPVVSASSCVTAKHPASDVCLYLTTLLPFTSLTHNNSGIFTPSQEVRTSSCLSSASRSRSSPKLSKLMIETLWY